MPGKRSTRQQIIRRVDGILTRLEGIREDILSVAEMYDETSGQTLAAALVAADNGLDIVEDLIRQTREQM